MCVDHPVVDRLGLSDRILDPTQGRSPAVGESVIGNQREACRLRRRMSVRSGATVRFGRRNDGRPVVTRVVRSATYRRCILPSQWQELQDRRPAGGACRRFWVAGPCHGRGALVERVLVEGSGAARAVGPLALQVNGW